MSRKKNEKILNKVPPQNVEAEKALLGCMLIDEEARIRTFESVRKNFFYSKIHQQIFSSIVKLFDKNEKCDLITLTNQLKQEGSLEEIGGVQYLAELVEIIPTSAHVEEYIKIVKDKYILRSLITNATQIIAEASNEPEEVEDVLDKAESLIFDVSQHKIEKEAYLIKDLIHETVELFEKIHNGEATVAGIPIGFSELDEWTTGFQPSDLIIIASRPSMGKTALASNIALNLATAGDKFPILFFSLEMSKEQLVQRMLCVEGKINLLHLRGGQLSNKEWGEMMQAAGRLSEAPIFIDDTPALNIFELRARARRLKTKENIQLVIVDYLQLMRGQRKAENRQQEISGISASLKALAKELKVPVIAVSQLSRATEQREGKEPQLSDLRESGAIEQDADLVLLLYRKEFYYPDDEDSKGKAEIKIAKQRNGPTGKLTLTFLKECTRFENFTPREE